MASVWLTSSTPLKLPPVIGTNALVLLPLLPLPPQPPHRTDAIGPNVSGLVPLLQAAGMGAAERRTIEKERDDEEGNRVSNHRPQQLKSRIEMSRHDERLKVTGLHWRKCPDLSEGCFFISIIYSRGIARADLTLCLQPSAN